jgi:hypothetical protein
LEALIGTHTLTVEILVAILLFNLIIPNLLKRRVTQFIKWIRIGYFSFWAFWSMVIFSGLVVFMFQKAQLPPDVMVMIATSIALPILDGYRAIKLRRVWIETELKELRLKTSNIIVLLEIALVALTTIISIKF